MGDHAGILGAVVFPFLPKPQTRSLATSSHSEVCKSVSWLAVSFPQFSLGLDHWNMTLLFFVNFHCSAPDVQYRGRDAKKSGNKGGKLPVQYHKSHKIWRDLGDDETAGYCFETSSLWELSGGAHGYSDGARIPKRKVQAARPSQ